MNKLPKIFLGIFIGSILVSLILYIYLPFTMGIHWNVEGYPDGFMEKKWAIWVMPAIILILGFVLNFAINADSNKENISKFKKEADLAVYSVLLFMLYVHALILAWNLFPRSFNIITPLIVGIGVLFISLAHVMKHAKRNYTIGIRTPWTLSSDLVWEKTHKVGSIIFVFIALVNFVGAFLVSHAFLILIASLLSGIIILVVYSYIVFKKIQISNKP